jgi:hypothetical protein
MLIALPKYLDLETPGLKIICDGNSITAFQSHATELGKRPPFSTNGTVIHNFGVGGQNTDEMLADFYTQVEPLITKTPPTILIALELGNSIAQGKSADQAAYAFERYCKAARHEGAYVIAITAHPRINQGYPLGVPAYSAELERANQILRDNWRRFADGIVDTRTIPEFSRVRNSWTPDNTHPNIYGDVLLTDALMPVLRRIPVRP